MSIDTRHQIYITDMKEEDIDDVVQIESEAYGEHHWAKSSFMMR